jgi:DNA-directed RNA polymerase specialized sigma24 family protein
MEMLTQFNQLVLQCQDDAYTLAWYLMGNETKAENVVQKAVEMAFRSIGQTAEPCRTRILRQVLRFARQRGILHLPTHAPQAAPALQSLPPAERQALLLIDVLNIPYPEAAAILELPEKQVARLAAQARWKVTAHGGKPI